MVLILADMDRGDQDLYERTKHSIMDIHYSKSMGVATTPLGKNTKKKKKPADKGYGILSQWA